MYSTGIPPAALIDALFDWLHHSLGELVPPLWKTDSTLASSHGRPTNTHTHTNTQALFLWLSPDRVFFLSVSPLSLKEGEKDTKGNHNATGPVSGHTYSQLAAVSTVVNPTSCFIDNDRHTVKTVPSETLWRGIPPLMQWAIFVNHNTVHHMKW